MNGRWEKAAREEEGSSSHTGAPALLLGMLEMGDSYGFEGQQEEREEIILVGREWAFTSH